MALGSNLKKKQGDSKEESSQKEGKVGEPADSAVGNAAIEDEAKEIEDLNEELEGSSEKRDMLIVFPVGDEEYALPIWIVKEVIEMPPLAPVPQTPAHILGVANVRGHVVVVMDLGVLIGHSDEKKSKTSFLLVLNSEDYQVAIRVNRVPDTMTIHAKDIEKPTNMIATSTYDEDFVTGVIKLDGRMILTVDIDQIINVEESQSLHEN